MHRAAETIDPAGAPRRFRRRGERAAVLAGALVVVVVVIGALVDGNRSVPATAVLIGPLVTGMVAGRRATAAIGALALAGTVVIAVGDELSLTGELPLRLLVVLAGAIAAVGLASVRLARERDLLALERAHDEDVRVLFERSAVPMIIADHEAQVIDVNDAAGTFFRLPAAELVGQRVGSRVHPDDRDPDGWSAVLSGEAPAWNGDVRIQLLDGEWRWVHVTASHLHGPTNESRRLLLQFVDVTERHRTEERLREAARRDVLTGLGNRAVLTEVLAEVASLERGSVGVLFVDLDRFKQVNDTYGHQVGDQLLIRTAEQLRSALRPGDVVCRYAGDEFVVVCRRCDGHGELGAIGRRLLEAVSRPLPTAKGSVPVSASVGGVLVELPTALSPEAMLEQADQALYRAKAEGRSRVVVPT
ncbi:sensor domain-containing diguanylate cyclase [Rhabdothermincola sp.]|uniref:sensor domain-containing diguanylate cyclase n=1 Tax=Rhabdothermincola sp. TaxID=2820405 RepID=UPI002FDFDCE0